MANEAGDVCADGLSQAAGYTLVSLTGASIGGTVSRMAVYGNWFASVDISAAFFTKDGYELTTVPGTHWDIPSHNDNGDKCHEFSSPGDFTAFNVSLGEYPGFYVEGNQDYTSGTEFLYSVVENTDVVDQLFSTFAGLTTLVADIEALVGSYCWGEESPDETPESWDTWSDGAAGSPVIDGDADWGKLRLRHEFGDIGHGPVKDLGSVENRWVVLTLDKYGSGSGSSKAYIRGQNSSFNQDDGSPAWEEYTGVVQKTWQYIQVKVETNF